MKRILCLVVIALTVSAVKAQKKPNVILILADDMGWTDLSCYGSKFYESPNIDKLASSGMKFTNAYSACNVCSPTRASILTGKSPARLHLTDWIPGQKMPFAKLSPPNWTMYLPLEETTIAELLKKNGYTTAAIGKWHLGANEKYAPSKQGFDFYYEGNNVKVLTDPNAGGKATAELTDAALKYMESRKDSTFFLYLPYYAVHAPLQAKQTDIDYFKEKADLGSKQKNPIYAGMIRELDNHVGRIMAKLKDLGLEKNTLVIFTSDNGGLIGNEQKNNTITSNLPARAGKGSPYEGGVRIPAIFSWQGNIAPGSSSSERTITMDLFNTIANIAAVPAFQSHDGVSLLPVLQGKQLKAPLHSSLYWHYPHYHAGGSTPYSSILEGDKRLVYFYETGKKELYNLKNDVAEAKDLYPSQRKEGEILYSKLKLWLENSNAQYPVPNPDYDEQKKNIKKARPEN